jgi:hypothetical protein
LSEQPKKYSIKMEITESDINKLSSVFARRILRGDFDHELEDLLEAAHHRKRELRNNRGRRT